MYFKTFQGTLRLTADATQKGILMTVDDNFERRQAKARLDVKTAKNFAAELNTLIERIEK